MCAIIITTGLVRQLAGNKRLLLALFLIVAESVIMIALTVIKIVPVWLLQVSILLAITAYGGHGQKFKGLFKIVVFYFQVMGVLVSNVHIWPESVYKIEMLTSNVVNFKFDSISCYMPEFFTESARLISLLVLLPAAVAATWAIYGIWYLVCEKKNPSQANKFKLKCKHYCLLFCDLIYFPVVKLAFSITVPSQNEMDQSFMKHYVWIDCGSVDHKILIVLASLAIPVYILGIPLFLYVPLLCYNREKIRNNDTQTKSWLGLLYLPYNEKYRTYMEVLLTMRRMIIAILLSVVPTEMPLQTFLIAVVFIIAIIHVALARPYKVYNEDKTAKNNLGSENCLEIATLSVLLCSFVSARFFIEEVTTARFSLMLSLILVANLMLLAALGISMLKRMFSSTKVKGEPAGPLLEGTSSEELLE